MTAFLPNFTLQSHRKYVTAERKLIETHSLDKRRKKRPREGERFF
jgi:hypothetical protein